MRLDQKKMVNRLLIYFFYDKGGIVDRYVPYMLNDLKKSCNEIFIVCNGKLTPEGRDVFNEITSNILVRENEGFDVWAYKTALEAFGWGALSEYDEVVMMNHTIMGPLYPLAEMFEEMDKHDVDFWGMTKYHKMDFDPFGKCKYGYIPEHIQSHFIAVRNKMLTSLEFKSYWEKMKPVFSYDEAIGYHEAVFTKTFADAGFVWDVYVNSDDYEGFTYYPLMMDPVRLIKNHKCPIFKRRSFIHNYEDYLNNSMGTQAKDLLKYLKSDTDYDVGMVWENILRTSNMAVIKNCLGLNYVLPKNYAQNKTVKKKTALVIHAYFEDLVDDCYRYAMSMPENSDIYVTVGSEKMEKLIKDAFLDGPWNSVTVIRVENRGRDVSALLVGVAKYLTEYDYVCFMHDKKVSQLDLGIKGYSFSERCFQNLLGSKELVSNIISLFEEEPNLGMLCPPPPNHADYYPTLGYEWGPNFDATKNLAQKLNLTCPMSLDHEPIAPLGTMFWFRPESLQLLLAQEWKYNDFPKEPIRTDGTLLHAIERIYPFVVQQSGYYCGWIMNDDYIQTEWQNLAFMLRSVNKVAIQIYGMTNHYGLVSTMRYQCQNNAMAVPIRLRIKWRIKKYCPKFIWKIARAIYRGCGGKKWVG